MSGMKQSFSPRIRQAIGEIINYCHLRYNLRMGFVEKSSYDSCNYEEQFQTCHEKAVHCLDRDSRIHGMKIHRLLGGQKML